MLLKVFIRNVYFGGYLNETQHAFIVYMFRQQPEVLHSMDDNALISGFGKGPIGTHVKISSCSWSFCEDGHPYISSTHLRVPSLHMSFSALTTWEGTRIVVSSMAAYNTPHSWEWLSNKFRKKHNLVYKKRWFSNMRCLQYHFQGSSTRNIIQCLRMQYFSIKFASWGDLLLFQGFYSLSGKTLVRCLTTWSREVLKPRDWML